MTPLASLLEITAEWRTAFPQARTHRRAQRQALGGLVCLGRRTLSRILSANGRAQKSWSADYFLHSRCRWRSPCLFQPIPERALPWCRGRFIGVAVDETRLRKTGRSIRQAFRQRDPLSPKFHPNLMLGLRFLQASLLVSGRRAEEDFDGGLRRQFLQSYGVHRGAREDRDHRPGAQERQALPAGRAGGGGVSMRPRNSPLSRSAKTSRSPGRRPSSTTGASAGRLRYKLLSGICWQGGARRLPLRLFVVAPTPYRKRKSSRLYYRLAAYLLTTELSAKATCLLQIYFDRRQIEVNHREEKDTLGVGQAQLRNPAAVPKQPALAVASYSALLLASLTTFGFGRGDAYQPVVEV